MQTVIEKIKKLLALSKSDNASEAANAAAAAQRLMVQHQIDVAEIGDVEEKAGMEVDPLFAGKSVPGWLNMLSAGLCKQNSVFVWLHRRSDSSSHICVAGFPSDVANVRFLFAYLRSEIERLTQKECRGAGRSIKDSYRKGAVVGAIEAMKKATAEVRATATPGALLKIDGKLAAARAAGPVTGEKRSSVSLSDADAFARGKAAGGHLHGSAQLGAAGGRMLGAG